MELKKVNVTIYSTIMIKVCGAEGESYQEIIDNALEAIDDRVVGNMNKVYVDPLSPTAKNLMGEVSYVEYDGNGLNRYVIIEDERENNEKQVCFQDHPLGYGPVVIENEVGELNTKSFNLLKKMVDFDDRQKDSDGIDDNRFKDFVEEARALVQIPSKNALEA